MGITELVPWKRSKKVPVRRRPASSLLDLQEEMDRWFEEFFGRGWLTPFRLFEEKLPAFSPRVDVVETDKEIKVSVELPGMTEEDIEVTLDDDMLTISGEKKSEHEEKEENYYYMERSYGSFRRVVPLPCSVDEEKVTATFKNGVLNIVLPKAAEAIERKRIKIKRA